MIRLNIVEEGNSMIYTDEGRSKDIPVNEEEFKKEWGLLTGAANF